MQQNWRPLIGVESPLQLSDWLRISPSSLLTYSADHSFGDSHPIALTGDGGLGAAIEGKEAEDEYKGSQTDQGDGVSQHLGLALCDQEKN